MYLLQFYRRMMRVFLFWDDGLCQCEDGRIVAMDLPQKCSVDRFPFPINFSIAIIAVFIPRTNLKEEKRERKRRKRLDLEIR